MSRELLSLLQAAKETGISRQAMYYHVRTGSLKASQIQPSGQWVIDRKDFQSWLAKREAAQPQPDRDD